MIPLYNPYYNNIDYNVKASSFGEFHTKIRIAVITGTMTGTTSAGLAFTVVATMAAASALAGRGRRSGRSGIVAD